MTSSHETIFASFTECPLAPLESIPTYDYLTELNAYLNACSSSVHSNLGCGTLGYLALTASPTVFALQCAVPFVEPVHPGATVTMPDPPPTAAVIGVITREHTEALRVFNEYKNVDKACKKVITNIIPEIYYKTLKNRYTGYTSSSTLQILTHLWTEYGEISEDDVHTNDSALKREITGETHFEELVAQVEDHQEAVAVQNPYTAAQILSIAYNLVKDTGFYDEGCKEWKRRPVDEKTWPNFKLFFSREFKENRQSNAKAKTGGFANNAESENEQAFRMEMAQEQTMALANLATATKSDRQAFTDLASTNATLTAKLLEMQKMQEKSALEISKLKIAAAKCKCADSRNTPRFTPDWDPTGYCWTHGHKVTVGHNSRNCKFKNGGHKDDATKDNSMGGSQKNKGWK